MNALKHLEQAEITIDAGYIDLARDLVYSLPERELDVCMAWMEHRTLGYKYYLSKFVFDSIEPYSVYTDKDGRSKDLLIYKAQLTLIRTMPSDVLSTPLPAARAKNRKDKSHTLPMSFLQA